MSLTPLLLALKSMIREVDGLSLVYTEKDMFRLGFMQVRAGQPFPMKSYSVTINIS